MGKIELLCPEVKKRGQTIQKARKQEFDHDHAEKILRKGRWKLPDNSDWVFKDQSIVKKAKKPSH